MGSIARYTNGTTFDPGSAPILIFSDETYDYYYCHPQVAYSVDKSSDETEWEAAGIEIIEKILSNSDNYSKI